MGTIKSRSEEKAVPERHIAVIMRENGKSSGADRRAKCRSCSLDALPFQMNVIISFVSYLLRPFIDCYSAL